MEIKYLHKGFTTFKKQPFQQAIKKTNSKKIIFVALMPSIFKWVLIKKKCLKQDTETKHIFRSSRLQEKNTSNILLPSRAKLNIGLILTILR